MKAKTYSIIEIDANDKTLVLASGLSRQAAIARLSNIRFHYHKYGLRFVMYHDKVAAYAKESPCTCDVPNLRQCEYHGPRA